MCQARILANALIERGAHHRFGVPFRHAQGGAVPLTPEQFAREKIDAQLAACGWVVQDYADMDFGAGRGIALREVPLKTGPCDYLLLVDRSTGKGITITLWEEEKDREITGPESRYYRDEIGKVVPLLTDAPSVEDLEIVIHV